MSWKPAGRKWAKPPLAALYVLSAFSHFDDNPSSREEERGCSEDITIRWKEPEDEGEGEMQ